MLGHPRPDSAAVAVPNASEIRAAAPEPDSSVMSAPAAKIRSPPQSTIAPGSRGASPQMDSASCPSNPIDRAFAFGRLSVTRATPSGRSSTSTSLPAPGLSLCPLSLSLCSLCSLGLFATLRTVPARGIHQGEPFGRAGVGRGSGGGRVPVMRRSGAGQAPVRCGSGVAQVWLRRRRPSRPNPPGR